MKICFRGMKFTGERRETIEQAVRDGGYEVEWLDKDAPFPVSAPEDYAALVGRFPKESIKELTNLKWLQLPHAGAESWVNEEMYANADVVLTNSSGVFGLIISEYMLGVMLMHAHHMPEYIERQKAHEWGRVAQNDAIFESCVCIVGTGDLGSCLATRVKALGAACVRGVNRSGRAAEGFDEIYTIDRLAKAVEGADYIAMTLPSTPSTDNVMNAEVLSHVKPTAFLVNCGRGNAVDEDALVAALMEGRLAGAALDVNKNEPLPADSPLWDVPNLLITPHSSGGDSAELNQRMIYDIVLENVKLFCAGEPLTHVVDKALGY